MPGLAPPVRPPADVLSPPSCTLPGVEPWGDHGRRAEGPGSLRVGDTSTWLWTITTHFVSLQNYICADTEVYILTNISQNK